MRRAMKNARNCSGGHSSRVTARGLPLLGLLAIAFVAAFVASLVATARLAAEARAAHDPTSDELRLELEPLDLPALATHHDVAQPPPQTFTFPADGWIRGYEIELVDDRGRAVARDVIHHVNLILPQRRELFSPIMLRLGAAGAETHPVRLPRLLGYRVQGGDTLLVTAMLHNPTAEDYHNVRLRLRFNFTARRVLPVVSIFPFYVDVMPPAGVHAYDLPPGRSEQSWEGRPAVPGRILGVGGHLHKYAVVLRFEDTHTGKTIWEATPVVDERGNVVAMPRRMFLRSLGVVVRPERVYRLTAVYENPTGAIIPQGGMGALGGVFLPFRAARWPRVNADDPQYRIDVATTRADVNHDASGHGHEDHRH